MPELPEVEGVVQALKPRVEGRTIQQVQLSERVHFSFSEGNNVLLNKQSQILLKVLCSR